MLDGFFPPPPRGVAVDAIAQFGDEVEVVIVGSPHRGPDGDWMLKILARRLSDGEQAVLSLPIGTLPLLSAGRVFVDGRRIDRVRTGRIGDLFIPDLADCTEVGSDETPAGLVEALGFPIGGCRGRPQVLLRYDVGGGRRVFIPAVELARVLYLRHAALAQAVMRPQALMELCIHPAPGRYPLLELAFTKALPVRLLKGRAGPLFAERFAWIAIDPEARRGWDSILRRTDGVLRLDPPAIRNAPCRVSWLTDGRDALVLEILTLGGRDQPCDALVFSHPDLVRKVRHVPGSVDGEDGPEDESDGDADVRGKVEPRDPPTTTTLTLAEDSRPSRSEGAKHTIASFGEEFIRDIPVRSDRRDVLVTGGRSAAVLVHGGEDETGAPTPAPRGERGGGETRAASGDGEGDAVRSGGGGDGPGVGGATGPEKTAAGSEPPKPCKRKVSVAEPGPGTVLKALEFELLEPMETDWIGGLGPLIEVLKRMDAKMPDVRVASSLTPLRDKFTISRVVASRLERRPALVGVLWPADHPPTVLVDVDHSGGLSLAMLALRYGAEPPMGEIETDVRTLLDAMVARTGAWNLDVVKDRTDKAPLDIERMAKVLRQPSAEKLTHYLGTWTLELIERLGFAGYVRA
jgi:hypothetical protein